MSSPRISQFPSGWAAPKASSVNRISSRMRKLKQAGRVRTRRSELVRKEWATGASHLAMLGICNRRMCRPESSPQSLLRAKPFHTKASHASPNFCTASKTTNGSTCLTRKRTGMLRKPLVFTQQGQTKTCTRPGDASISAKHYLCQEKSSEGCPLQQLALSKRSNIPDVTNVATTTTTSKASKLLSSAHVPNRDTNSKDATLTSLLPSGQ